MRTPMIAFEAIHKSFGAQQVLRGVSVQVRAGELVFIVGKSGAGKSVLAKMLVGLLRPDRGRVFFEGQDITHYTERDFYALRRQVALVFQHSTLFDSLNVLDNVALPLRKHHRLSAAEARAQAMPWLARLDLEPLAARMPAELGDGLRKRVAIARALCLQPRAVIFDEPTTGLDPVSARQTDALMRRLADELAVSCLVISHDLRSIFGIADRVVMLYEGRVHLDASPEAFRQSEDAVIQQFIHGRAQGPMRL